MPLTTLIHQLLRVYFPIYQGNSKSLLGHCINPHFFRLSQVQSDMLSLFGKAKFSKYGEPETKIPLKPTLSSAYSKSKDPAELAHYWTEVREQTGKKLREMWIRNVALNQEVAR